MAKDNTGSQIPLSIVMGAPEIATRLQDVVSYVLLEAIFDACEVRRSKDRDPSVTTAELSEFVGDEEYHIQLHLRSLSQPPNALLEVKDERRSWRVRMTPSGYRGIAELQDIAVERRARFLDTVERRWKLIRAKLQEHYSSPADLPGGIVSEVRIAVENDLGRTVAFLKTLHHLTGGERAPRKWQAKAPGLAKCKWLRDELLRKAQKAENDPTLEEDAESIRMHVTDMAQREIARYLVRSRYPAVIKEIQKNQRQARPLLIVLDLNVIIGCLCASDRLNVPVNECFATARTLGIGSDDAKGQFLVPAAFNELLRQQLERRRADYEFVRTVWSSGKSDPAVGDRLERLAGYSLSREFIYNWKGSAFDPFVRKTMAAYRSLCRKFGVVDGVGDISEDGYDRHMQSLMDMLSNRFPDHDVKLWTFDAALGRMGYGLAGGVLHAFLDPDRLVKIHSAEEALVGLEDLHWWRTGLIGRDAAQFRDTVTKEFVAAISMKLDE